MADKVHANLEAALVHCNNCYKVSLTSAKLYLQFVMYQDTDKVMQLLASNVPDLHRAYQETFVGAPAGIYGNILYLSVSIDEGTKVIVRDLMNAFLEEFKLAGGSAAMIQGSKAP